MGINMVHFMQMSISKAIFIHCIGQTKGTVIVVNNNNNYHVHCIAVAH